MVRRSPFLGRAVYRPRLKYALILVDALYFLRGLAASELIIPGVGLGDVIPPELVVRLLPFSSMFVAPSGAFRFSVPAAVRSAASALAAEVPLGFVTQIDFRVWAAPLVLMTASGTPGLRSPRPCGP